MKLRLFSDVIGLHPWKERFRQAMIALRGEEDVPSSKFGLSSLKQLRPKISIPLWRGRHAVPGKVILTNLFNHRQSPIEEGWSVKVTDVEDWRGGQLTYDSHNGTDFSIPVGTKVLTAAPGVVVKICSEFNRGGLKIFIDHGRGLMTNYAHLAHSLVSEGDIVSRGQVIALSGYSGLDALVTFPFGVPHVHFNTWLNGEPIDPFTRKGTDDASMWQAGAFPACYSKDLPDIEFEPSVYDEEAIQEMIDHCKTAKVRDSLQMQEPLSRRAAHTIIESNYYPTRFPKRRNPYDREYPRGPRLDLPFSDEDFDGIVFADEL